MRALRKAIRRTSRDLRNFNIFTHSYLLHLTTSTMICRRCLLRAARRNGALSTSTSRTLSSSRVLAAEAISAQVTTATNPRPHGNPAATSTSAAQPFSEPLTYSPQLTEDLPIERQQGKKPLKVQSSVPAGTVLKGLNFMKNSQDPIALEDEEYPDWLWGVLEKRVDGSSGAGKEDEGGDLFCTCYQRTCVLTHCTNVTSTV